MLAPPLAIAKRQAIETYFASCGSERKASRAPFCDRSGEMPCWYWKRVQYQRSAPLLGKEVTQIVSREHDGTKYVWRVYQGSDFLAKSVTKKTIRVSEEVFRNVTIFFPEPKDLQIEDIRCTGEGARVLFVVEDKPTEDVRESDFFDFVLSVPKTMERRLDQYIRSRMEEIHTQAPLVYLQLKKFYGASGLHIDPGLKNFTVNCSAKSLFPPPASASIDLEEAEKETIPWDRDGEDLYLIKPGETPCFFAVKQDGNWEMMKEVWVVSPSGSLLGTESQGDIILCCALLQLLEFERTDEGCRALFYLNAKASVLDPTQIISPSQRGIFAVRYANGYFLYVENPYFDPNANQKRFLLLPVPLISPEPQFLFVDQYDPTQQMTSFQKCPCEQVMQLFHENDRGKLYALCFELLGKKDGVPLTFFAQGSSPSSQASNDVALQKKPLERLLNRTYFWHSDAGDLVFFEYTDGQPIWKIYDPAGNIHTPETVEFSDEKFVFPQNKHFVPILDPLRLVSISPDKKKVVFRIVEQKSSVDDKTPVSPTRWNLTMIVDGSAGEFCGQQINLHTRVYLQTPESSSVIEIHLTTHGLLARELSQAEIARRKQEKKIKRRGQVVAISPSSQLIHSILNDFDRGIQLDVDFENCTKYAVEVFNYAGRPFAENHLNPFDSPRNPLAFTSSSSSSSEIGQVHPMQESRALSRCTQGNKTLVVYERENGPNFFYFVYVLEGEKKRLLFKEDSGFRHTVFSLKVDDQGFHLVLRRTGLLPFTTKKTFKLD